MPLSDADISKFLRSCAPVLWVHFWTECHDPAVKDQLRNLLFDSDGLLRELSDPVAASHFVSTILSSTNLRIYIERQIHSRCVNKPLPFSSEETSAENHFSERVYNCGLLPNEKLLLIKDLAITNFDGTDTGKVHKTGEIWDVLPASETSPDVVWLRRPDGKLHTWDDSSAIFEHFRRVHLES